MIYKRNKFINRTNVSLRLEISSGTGLRLAFKEGLSLEIIRLPLTKSSEAEEQEDRILKSLSDAVWPVSAR